MSKWIVTTHHTVMFVVDIINKGTRDDFFQSFLLNTDVVLSSFTLDYVSSIPYTSRLGFGRRD